MKVPRLAMPQTSSNILALDIGESRIGVAMADSVARLPKPLATLKNSRDIMHDIRELAAKNQAGVLVVGLPRGLDGQDTAQTVFCRQFADRLRRELSVAVHLQDEAVTSAQAKQELESRRKPYAKGDIDALAATYILEDFLGGSDYDHPKLAPGH